MEYDGHNNVKAVQALDHQEITTDTTTVGDIIDTKGFESIEFIFQSGVVTDGTYTVLLEDGDDSGLSDAAVIPTALVLGTLHVFAAANDNEVKRTGTITKKRYVRVSLVSAATTVGAFMGAVAVQGHPHTAPIA